MIQFPSSKAVKIHCLVWVIITSHFDLPYAFCLHR